MRDSREAAQSAPLSLLVPGRVAPGGARCRPAGAAVVGFAYRLPSETAPGAARSTTRLEFAGARGRCGHGQPVRRACKLQTQTISRVRGYAWLDTLHCVALS